ncbi:MAG: tetratricopeptide repeat protein [Candidatus Kapabacteria bacterium]|nr:tetratricopeptide repeat protein [Candidatus Kapabacteria bacterium]
MTPEEIQQALEKLRNLGQTSQYNEAKALANELMDNPAIQHDPESLTKVYNVLGNVYQNLSDYPKALEYHSKALQINEEIGKKDGIATNLGNIGITYRNLSDYPKALEYYTKALQLSEEIGEKFGIAKNLANIGVVYDILSDYPNALEYYSKSIQIFEEIGFTVGIAASLGNIGNLYNRLSDYPKAIEYHTKSLQINEEIGKKESIASNLGNIGIVYSNLIDFPKALEYYTKALQINEEILNKNGIAINLGNIGILYSNLFDYPKALEYYSKALRINEEIGYKYGIAINLRSFGNVYNRLLDYPKAIEYYTKALHINEEIKNKHGIATILGNIGTIYSTKESSFFDLKKAEEYLQRALVLSEELVDKSMTQYVYDNLHTLRYIEGHFEEALDYYKKSKEIEKEILSEEAKKNAVIFDQRRKIEEDEKARQLKLARFKEQERIFHNILPISIADRLIEGEQTIAESFENVSIFFSDIVGFTTLSSNIEPAQLVKGLNTIFTAFDRIATKYGLEKIKTIGDAYMAVCGVPEVFENHAQRATNFALEAIEVLHTLELGEDFKNLQIRIGLHCGSVVAGIIGEKKFAYDVWGDAVNVASRMESNSEPGRIHSSEQFAKSIESYQEFTLIPRGEIIVKGKGTMSTFWIEKGK